MTKKLSPFLFILKIKPIFVSLLIIKIKCHETTQQKKSYQTKSGGKSLCDRGTWTQKVQNGSCGQKEQKTQTQAGFSGISGW